MEGPKIGLKMYKSIKKKNFLKIPNLIATFPKVFFKEIIAH